MRRLLVIMISALLVGPAFAIDQGVVFDDPAMQARYEKLISEVRCLQCQNQSIKDSNVTLAADLRREIARGLFGHIGGVQCVVDHVQVFVVLFGGRRGDDGRVSIIVGVSPLDSYLIRDEFRVVPNAPQKCRAGFHRALA